MKGIRKLFFGLILMTLIGVGFKVDVKAAQEISITNFEEPSSWNTSDSEMVITFNANEDMYTNPGTSVDFDIKGSTSLRSVTVTFVKKTDGTYSIELSDTTNARLITTPPYPTENIELAMKVNTSSVNTLVTNGGGTTTLTASESKGSSMPLTVTASTVTESATYSGGTFPSGTTVVFSKTSPFYLLKGETKTISITTGPGGGYKLDGWYVNGEKIIGNTVDVEGTGSGIAVRADYKKNNDALKITGLEGRKILRGVTTSAMAYDLSGGSYTKTDLENSTVTIADGTSRTPTVTNSDFKFLASHSSTGTKVLTIKMPDGLEYTYNIVLFDSSDITFKFEGSPYTTYVGTTISATPTISGAQPESVTYSPMSTANYSASQSGTSLLITGVSLTGGTAQNITASPVYNIDGYTDPTYTLKVNVEATPTITLSDLYVNEGLTANLSDYASYAGTVAPSVSITDESGGLVEFNNKNTTVDKIKYTGKNSGTKSSGVTLNPGSKKADVTVYPRPTLESGSSKLTITMPYGVHYNGIKKENLTQAVLVFKGSDGSETTDPISMGSSSSSSGTKSLSKTKEVTLSKGSSSSSSSSSDDINLTSIFKEVCSGDEDTVSVKAYAYYNSKKDDNIVSTEDVTIKVYKIKLEGNASYKVDGQDVSSGYFYAAKGSNHTVSISGTGTLDKNNSSSEFANSTSVTLSGVAGVKTLRANYTGTSSSAPSSSSGRNAATAGEGMDDYDDVPKTGESKADIWILWSVLFVSILGAGFMIWKRFGLVRAIAEADEEVAVAEHKEEVKAKKKEKEDKIKMLKDLRNL